MNPVRSFFARARARGLRERTVADTAPVIHLMKTEQFIVDNIRYASVCGRFEV